MKIAQFFMKLLIGFVILVTTTCNNNGVDFFASGEIILFEVDMTPRNVIPKMFTYENFKNSPYLIKNGNAKVQVESLVLVDGLNKVGNVFFSKPLDGLSEGFVCDFVIRINDITNKGGDGFSFIVQDGNPHLLGGYLGYEDMDANGIAITFQLNRDDLETRKIEIKTNLASNQYKKVILGDAGLEGSFTYTLPSFLKTTKNKQKIPIKIVYDASLGMILIWNKMDVSTKDWENKDIDNDGYVYDDDEVMENENERWYNVARYQINNVAGLFNNQTSYYVGFGASSSLKDANSYTKTSLTYFSFGVVGQQGCLKDFNGPGCSLTDDEAYKYCHLRTNCMICVQETFNCAWCGNECVVGNKEGFDSCKGKPFAMEEAACSGLYASSLYLFRSFYLNALLICAFVVITFSFVLMKTVPSQALAYRIINTIISTVLGGFSGMAFSFAIAACLVEISSNSFFAVMFGVLFLFQSLLLANHVYVEEIQAGVKSKSNMIQLSAIACLFLLSSVFCFVLDKQFVDWLPESRKVVMFSLLSMSLTCSLVFACFDVWHQVWLLYLRKTHATIKRKLFLNVLKSKSATPILSLSAVFAGCYFGYVFASLHIEEQDSVYLASLKLREEGVYTYPVGALVGALSGLIVSMMRQGDEATRDAAFELRNSSHA